MRSMRRLTHLTVTACLLLAGACVTGTAPTEDTVADVVPTPDGTAGDGEDTAAPDVAPDVAPDAITDAAQDAVTDAETLDATASDGDASPPDTAPPDTGTDAGSSCVTKFDCPTNTVGCTKVACVAGECTTFPTAAGFHPDSGAACLDLFPSPCGETDAVMPPAVSATTKGLVAIVGTAGAACGAASCPPSQLELAGANAATLLQPTPPSVGPFSCTAATCEPLHLGHPYVVKGYTEPLPGSFDASQDAPPQPGYATSVEIWCMRPTVAGIEGEYAAALGLVDPTDTSGLPKCGPATVMLTNVNGTLDAQVQLLNTTQPLFAWGAAGFDSVAVNGASMTIDANTGQVSIPVTAAMKLIAGGPALITATAYGQLEPNSNAIVATITEWQNLGALNALAQSALSNPVTVVMMRRQQPSDYPPEEVCTTAKALGYLE